MSPVAVPGMRSTIVSEPEGLSINIPARRQILVILFLPFWLVMWLFGEVFVTGMLLTGNGPILFMTVWLAFWTFGGAFAVFAWFWMIAGRERLILKPGLLVHRLEVFGIGRSREYEIAHVQNLRVSPEPQIARSWSAYLRLWGLGGGVIAFDYGAKTIRFAASLDEAEGRMIVTRMKEQYGLAHQAG